MTMRKIILGLLTALAFGSTVQAQTLPASTVVGRLGIGPGPAQSIPFATLSGVLFGSGSGVFGLTLSGNTNYAMVTTDRTVLINAALTASRTVTLFAAAALTSGQQVCIADAFGGVTSANTLVVARAGSDTINGATSYVVGSAFGGVCLISDGVSKWTNSNSLAQVPANTVKCNPTTSTANPIDCQFPVLNVKDYGAVCDGTGNDATAINNAIAALPASGGIVEFPATNCRITSPIQIGNGTGSAASSRQGVVLRGVGLPVQQGFPGFTAVSGPKITWAGGTGSSIINIAGPLQGWGVQNLYLDCASIGTSQGITVTSAQQGDNRNLAIANCTTAAIASSTVALFGAFTNTDSFNNKWYQTTIVVPNSANARAISLNGAAATTNTDFNTFISTEIFLPSAVVAVQGIYFTISDSNAFYNTHIYGGNASASCVVFDYGGNNSFPGSNRFTGIDVGTCGGGTQFAVFNTPGAGAKPNYLFVDEGNGTTCPLIVNVACDGAISKVTNVGGNNAGVDILSAWTAFTPSPTCGTATITTQGASRKTMGKTTFIRAEFTITVLGTCTGIAVPFQFTGPINAASTAVIGGQEIANSGRTVSCRLAAASATVSACEKADAIAYVVNDHIIVSGAFENQ